MEPLVSIVTAGYNANRYLLGAIKSGLAQTYRNIEYIYVDDCSTDESCSTIENRISDKRFVLLRNNSNIGQSASLNKGIRAAKGEYIAILDADDMCMPFRIRKQVMLLESLNSCNICGTGYRLISERGETISNITMEYSSNECKYRLQFNNIIAHSTIMYRTAAINTYKCYTTDYGIAENYEHILRLLREGDIALVKESCIQYRICNDGITRNLKAKMKKAQYLIMKAHYRDFHDIEITQKMYENHIKNPNKMVHLKGALRVRKLVKNSLETGVVSKSVYNRVRAEVIRKVLYATLINFKRRFAGRTI